MVFDRASVLYIGAANVLVGSVAVNSSFGPEIGFRLRSVYELSGLCFWVYVTCRVHFRQSVLINLTASVVRCVVKVAVSAFGWETAELSAKVGRVTSSTFHAAGGNRAKAGGVTISLAAKALDRSFRAPEVFNGLDAAVAQASQLPYAISGVPVFGVRNVQWEFRSSLLWLVLVIIVLACGITPVRRQLSDIVNNYALLAKSIFDTFGAH